MTTDAVHRWLLDRAVPVPTARAGTTFVTGPTAVADVVGVGAAVRHAAGTVAAVRALLTDLVAHHGFRALVIEGTDPPFDTAPALDAFVVDGVGDPRALVAASQGFLRTEETLGLLLALRARNVGHPDDPVRVVHGTGDGRPWDDLAAVERGLADRSLAWREVTGQKVVHWGGSAHVLVGDPRSISPGGTDQTHRNAGGHLRAALGERYAAVAATIGTVAARPGLPAVPPLAPSFTEAALAPLTATSWVSLRDADAPDEVRAWLDAPLRSRMIGPAYDPDHDADHHVSAPSLRAAVDAFMHVPRSAADTPL